MKNSIISHMTCPWQDKVQWFPTIDSTSTYAKTIAKEGAPAGTLVIAGAQSAGRGRLGRSFSSPDGMGVYLSCILRPDCTPDKLMHLTCAVGAAMCQAVERPSGLIPALKWTNDLVVGKRKLGGILTELSVSAKTGIVEYAVVGIGINCLQKTEDFPPELQEMATSLSMEVGKPVSPALLAAAMGDALYDMDQILLTGKKELMDAYRAHCMTLGKTIRVVRGAEDKIGTALELDEDGGLLVEYADGFQETVTSGEVSVRGMYGYL